LGLEDLVAKFSQVYIDQDSVDSPLGVRLRHLFPQAQVVNGLPSGHQKGELSARQFSLSKKQIYLTRFKGQFFKRCPGSRPGLACCNYFVLNWGVQCDLNCSYCYLQSFINSSVLTLYSNLEDGLQELDEMSKGPLGQMQLRVGTGETVDSLSMDPLTLHSLSMVRFFRKHPRWTCEFKTKSNHVDAFLDEPHAGNVVVSWSINPSAIVAHEEHETASLEDRLDAAVRCRDKGFPIAFHIDPMIYFPDWQQAYAELIDQICARFSPACIPYLSVGSLRFQPEQRAMMRERFGMDSWVNQGEMFLSRDGKLRYDRRLREEMYNFVVGEFKKRDQKWKLFMCMETPETWLATTGASPFKSQELSGLFDTRVVSVGTREVDAQKLSATPAL
jgi:spore photoproduct lyase